MRKLTGWMVVAIVAVVAVSFGMVHVVDVAWAQSQTTTDATKEEKKAEIEKKKAEKKAAIEEKKAAKKADLEKKKAAIAEKKAAKKAEIEQKKAAILGEYSAQILLDHPSAAVKDPASHLVVEDLQEVLRVTHPRTIYTHNLADKHDTHVAVALRVIQALRALKPAELPLKVYGCEVWRDLDWLHDSDKVAFDVSAHENLQAALLGVFDSQIAGGKRYDLATLGRRRANATYHASHGVDVTTGTVFAMDLTPLILNPELRPAELIDGLIEGFHKDVGDRLARLEGR